MPSKGAHASPSRCIIEVSPSELTDGLYERCNGKEPCVVHPKNPEVAYHGNMTIFSEDLSHAILKLQTRAPNMETTTPEPSSLVPSPLRGACPSPVPVARPKANAESDQRQQPLTVQPERGRIRSCRWPPRFALLQSPTNQCPGGPAAVPKKNGMLVFPSAEHKPPHTAALMHSMFLEAMAYMTGSAFDESMGLCPSLKFY